MTQEATPALTGLRVIELGRRIGAPVVGLVLAEQGAEVIRIVDASSPSADPVLDALLARGKTEIHLDLSREEGRATLRGLVDRADVLVENRGLGGLGLDLAAIRSTTNPGLILCSVPNFPLGDPRSDWPDYEAAVGTVGYLYAKPIGAPWVHEFPLGSVLAGLFAANGVLAALIARLRTGRGQDVSASLFHADIFAQVVLILMRTGIPRGFLPLKMVGTPFMGSWLCGDGRYIYLHISLPAHNARILEILDANGYAADVRELRSVLSADTMRDPSQVRSIPEAKAIRVVYERIFKSRSADDWEILLGMELCCIKVRTIEEWLPASIEAGMADACTIEDPTFGEMLATGPTVSLAEQPPVLRARDKGESATILARWEARKPMQTGAALAHPLEGIRVVDLSRVIAGPCAARILAELGAEVLSIQSPSNLDWALSFHLLFNAGKKSVTLDFSDDAGKKRLWALMEDFQPHAFIQNYRHLELARKIGVGPEALRARFPQIAYTHLNAYGNLGVWRDRPGFEQVVQAVSGIQMTYGRDGKPKLLPTPVIDIGSGLLGAFATLLGLYRQQREGLGTVATTHLTRMAVLFQVQPIVNSQRERCMAAARSKGLELVHDPRQRVVGGILRARDAFFTVTGPLSDVEAWIRQAGLESEKDGAGPLGGVSRRVHARSVAHWQRSVAKAGLEGRVLLVPVPSLKHLVEDVAAVDRSPLPPVRKRDYSGVSMPLTFISNPIRMSATPLKDVDPSPMRGENTREVLARIGVEPPPGDGVIPYPAAKPLLVWAGTLVRWGYFAWRSGNI